MGGGKKDDWEGFNHIVKNTYDHDPDFAVNNELVADHWEGTNSGGNDMSAEDREMSVDNDDIAVDPVEYSIQQIKENFKANEVAKQLEVFKAPDNVFTGIKIADFASETLISEKDVPPNKNEKSSSKELNGASNGCHNGSQVRAYSSTNRSVTPTPTSSSTRNSSNRSVSPTSSRRTVSPTPSSSRTKSPTSTSSRRSKSPPPRRDGTSLRRKISPPASTSNPRPLSPTTSRGPLSPTRSSRSPPSSHRHSSLRRQTSSSSRRSPPRRSPTRRSRSPSPIRGSTRWNKQRRKRSRSRSRRRRSTDRREGGRKRRSRSRSRDTSRRTSRGKSKSKDKTSSDYVDENLLKAPNFREIAEQFLNAPTVGTEQAASLIHPSRPNLVLLGSEEATERVEIPNKVDIAASEDTGDDDIQITDEVFVTQSFSDNKISNSTIKEDAFDENSDNLKRFVRLNFHKDALPEFKRRIINSIVSTTSPVKVFHVDSVTIEYYHPMEANKFFMDVESFSLKSKSDVENFSCMLVGKKNDDQFIENIAENYKLNNNKKFLLVAASVKLLFGGSSTLGHCIVPVELELYTWSHQQPVTIPMLPYAETQDRKKKSALTKMNLKIRDKDTVEFQDGDTSHNLTTSDLKTFQSQVSAITERFLKRYSPTNHFDECILVLPTWREATTLLRWISALPLPDDDNIFKDFTRILVKKDELGDGSLTDCMMLHHDVHVRAKKDFAEVYELSQPCPQLQNKNFTFRSDLKYKSHCIIVISLEYDDKVSEKGTKKQTEKIISKISCHALKNKGTSKTFIDEGKDEKTLLIGLYAFCEEFIEGKSATLLAFSSSNTVLRLIQSLQRYSMYQEFCFLFSSFTDFHTIMSNKCPEYKASCCLPDYNWICNYFQLDPKYNGVEDVCKNLVNCLKMLFDPDLHEGIQEHSCSVSMMYHSQIPTMNIIKLQDELVFEDGETLQQQFYHSLGSSSQKLHISESLNSFLRVKALDLSQDKLTLELTNVSSSRVMEKGANIVKLFAYAKSFAIHLITSLERTSVDPIKCLKLQELNVDYQSKDNIASPTDTSNQDNTTSAAAQVQADHVFSRSISVNKHKVQSKKIPIEADVDIVLFPKQSKTIEIDFKELRALPKATVEIEKVPEDKNYICKLSNQDELVFGKLTFVIVSQTKGKLNFPAGHCFGYLNLDPRILNVNDIQISFSSNSEERVGNSSGQNTLESEDVEMMDVSDLDTSAISEQSSIDRQIIVQDPVEVQKTPNPLIPQLVQSSTNDENDTHKDETAPTEDEFNLSFSSDKETLVGDRISQAEDGNSISIITGPVNTKFVFSSCVPGFNGIIEAARSYTISSGKVIEDVIVECIVHAMNSLATFDKTFSSFSSIAQFLKNNAQKKREQIIQILDKKSMNLFSKIMSQDLMDSFLSIMYHILPDFVDAGSSEKNLEDLSVTDIPGKGSVQPNSSFSLEDICDALTEAGQSPGTVNKKKKLKKKSKVISKPIIGTAKLVPSSSTTMESIVVPAQLLADPIATSDSFGEKRCEVESNYSQADNALNVQNKIVDKITKETNVTNVKTVCTTKKVASTISSKNVVSSNVSKPSGTTTAISSGSPPATSSGTRPVISTATPATSSGTTPVTSSGSTPAASSETRPVTSTATPATSSGTKPATSSGSTTVTSSGTRPASSSGKTKPVTSSGTKPATSSGSTTVTLSGTKHATSSVSTPATSSGTTPAISSGSTPATSSGITPATSSGTTPATSSGSTPVTSSGSIPAAVEPSASSSGQSVDCTPVIPDPARYFVNLHVGMVLFVNLMTYVKTDKGNFFIEMNDARTIGFGEKVLIQVDKDNAVKWMYKLSNWNLLKHCYIGKVVEENPINKIITVEYNGKKRASLNMLRVKNLESDKEINKIGTSLMIYVAPNQEFVSLAIFSLFRAYSGDAMLLHFVENLGILQSSQVEKGSSVAFHRNALFNLDVKDLMNTKKLVLVKFSAFKLETPYLLKTLNTSAVTDTCLNITHFAYKVHNEESHDTKPLTIDIIQQVKDDLKILDDYGVTAENNHAKQLHYCTHYPVLNSLCRKFYLEGCTNPSHKELHALPEKLGQNMSLMCKKYFAKCCNTARCTKLHKTFESLEDQLQYVLNKKREKCTECFKIPCKQLSLTYLMREPCFKFMTKGNCTYGGNCRNLHYLPRHMTPDSNIMVASSVQEFVSIYKQKLELLKAHCLQCAKQSVKGLQLKPAKLFLVKKNAAVPTFNSNLGNGEHLIQDNKVKDNIKKITESPARVSRYDSSTDVSVENTSNEDVITMADKAKETSKLVKKDNDSLNVEIVNDNKTEESDQQVLSNQGQIKKETLTDTVKTTKESSSTSKTSSTTASSTSSITSSVSNITTRDSVTTSVQSNQSVTAISSKSTDSVSITQAADERGDQERDEKLQQIENKIESVRFKRTLETVEKKIERLKKNKSVNISEKDKVTIDNSTKNVNASSNRPKEDTSKNDNGKKDDSEEIETLKNKGGKGLASNKDKTLNDNISVKTNTNETNLNHATGENIVHTNKSAEKSDQSGTSKTSTNEVKESNKESSKNPTKNAAVKKSVAPITPTTENGVTNAKKPCAKKDITPKSIIKIPKAPQTAVKTSNVISLTPKIPNTNSANTSTSKNVVTANKVILTIPKISSAKKTISEASNVSAAKKVIIAVPKIPVNNEKLISLNSSLANRKKNIAVPTQTSVQSEVTFNVTDYQPRKQINKIVMDNEDGDERYVYEDDSLDHVNGNERYVYEDDSLNHVDSRERYDHEDASLDHNDGITVTYYDNEGLSSPTTENKPLVNFDDDSLKVTVKNDDFPTSAKRRRSRDESSPSYAEEDYVQAGPSIRSRLTLDRPGPPAKRQKTAKVCRYFANGGCARGDSCFYIHDLRSNLDDGDGIENRRFRLISDKKYMIKHTKEKIHARLEIEGEDDVQSLSESKFRVTDSGSNLVGQLHPENALYKKGLRLQNDISSGVEQAYLEITIINPSGISRPIYTGDIIGTAEVI